ncbi:prolipoprotein diacylglyceryl transferase [Anaerolineales bacterium HSG25]|nr:prolipoprotein diacylglyceryl transferase [Anaerolineales bacterium HSG25]
MPSPENPILFEFGPFMIRWYGLLIVTGALLAAYVGTIEAKRRRENPDHVWNLLIWCLIFGILGARLYHVLSSPPGASRGFNYYFYEQPFTDYVIFGITIPFPTALQIWSGGIGIFGALLGGIIAVLIYTYRENLIVWRWLDVLAPGMILAQAVGRWGNYFNQELYGPPTDLPWGILITNFNQRITPYNDLTAYPLDTMFHPVFLYESLWNLVGFALMMWIGRKYASKLYDGDILSIYLIWYPLGRLLIENLRPDAWVISGIPTAQIVSGLLIILGVGLAVFRHQNPQQATKPNIDGSGSKGRRRHRAQQKSS